MTDFTYDTVQSEMTDDGIRTITLNRPDKLNSMRRQMHAELRAAFDKIEARGCRAVLLTGEGRAFCAGQDLSDLDAVGCEERSGTLPERDSGDGLFVVVDLGVVEP